MRREKSDMEIKTARHLSSPDARRVALSDIASECKCDMEWREYRKSFDVYSISIVDLISKGSRFLRRMPKNEILSIDMVTGKITR